jgi:hypothetical protein
MMSFWFLAACLPLVYPAPKHYLVETSGGEIVLPQVSLSHVATFFDLPFYSAHD